MKKVYIIQHYIDDFSEIISVSLDIKIASIIFNAYINALETEWRTEEEANKNNTFNKFSEPTDDILLSADVERTKDGDKKQHNVFVTQFDTD